MDTIKLGAVTVKSVSSTNTNRPSRKETKKINFGAVQSFASITEAQTAIPFQIWQPTNLPPTVLLTEVVALGQPGDTQNFSEVFLRYNASETSSWIVVSQRELQLNNDDEIILKVRHPVSQGIHIDTVFASFSHVVDAPAHPNKKVEVQHILWEQNGLLMEVQNQGFSLQDVISLIGS